MQQDRGKAGSDQDMKQNLQQQQDRRLKPGENQQPQQQQQQQQQQQHPPQKCPRCESLNTKFCYYNNYSLSQPRYFCKTCRRYWTQGGTLRNVPVGGGCRKGKRTKISSSSSVEHSRLSQQPLMPQRQQSLISSNPMISAASGLRTEDSGALASSSAVSSMGSYYPGGGFLSSLAAIQSINQPHTFTQPLNQALSIVGDLGGSPNLGLLQGYSAVHSFGSTQQPQQTQFFEMGNREKTVNLYPSIEEPLIQSSRPTAGTSHDQNWHRSLIGSNNPTVSEPGLWSINTSSAGNTNTTTTNIAGPSSLNPNQWPSFQGYGAPP